MLDFNGDGVYELVWSGYPVDCTDGFRTIWKLELPRKGSFDMDFTFFHFRRKSIFWNVQLKPTIHPLKALGLASVGEGGVVNDLNTTQVSYNQMERNQQIL